MNLKIRAIDTRSNMLVELTEIDFINNTCKYLPIGTNPKIADICNPMSFDNLINMTAVIDETVIIKLEKEQ